MKVPEVRITSYCSFCAPYKKVEAECVCFVCADDVCYEHANQIALWRKGMVERMRSMGRRPTPNFMTVRLVPICPNCAREDTLFSVLKKVARRESEAAPNLGQGKRRMVTGRLKVELP